MVHGDVDGFEIDDPHGEGVEGLSECDGAIDAFRLGTGRTEFDGEAGIVWALGVRGNDCHCSFSSAGGIVEVADGVQDWDTEGQVASPSS